jgi:hypothetical protein
VQELLRQRLGVWGAMKDKVLGHGDLGLFGVKPKF